MTISININQINHDLVAWVHHVTAEGESVMLMADGHPQAVLISLHDWQILQKMRASRAERLAALEQAQSFGEQVRAARSADDVDVVTLLHTVREGRDAELQGLY